MIGARRQDADGQRGRRLSPYIGSRGLAPCGVRGSAPAFMTEILVVPGRVLCSSARVMAHETPKQHPFSHGNARLNPLRRLYVWTLHWAGTTYALPALVLLAFAESSFFPVPPDVLLIALCFATPGRWLRLAIWCTAGSVVGGLLGYLIGWGLWDAVGQPIVHFYHGEAVIEAVRHWYQAYGFLGVFAAALTPIPYKVFTIASGMMRFDVPAFVLASVLGRGLRFFLVAGLIRFFGAQVRPFLEKHFELAAFALVVLGVLGFVLIRYFF